MGSALVSQPWRVTRGLGPGPRFGEPRRNSPQQASQKALILKGFLSFGVFHRMPKYSRVVLAPRHWRQVRKDAYRVLRVTVARKPGSPRRSRISRKTIAQGMF